MEMSPIIVTGPARSGTSLTAGLIHHHGVWTGLCRPPKEEVNPIGFFENRRIWKVLRGVEEGAVGPRKFPRLIREVLRKEKYPGGPWVVKHPLHIDWKVWLPFKPIWVLVKRNSISIMLSRNKVGYIPPVDISVEEEFDILNGIRWESKTPVFDVRPGLIVKGHYSHLSGVLKEVGLEYSKEVVQEFIQSDLWHYNNFVDSRIVE